MVSQPDHKLHCSNSNRRVQNSPETSQTKENNGAPIPVANQYAYYTTQQSGIHENFTLRRSQQQQSLVSSVQEGCIIPTFGRYRHPNMEACHIVHHDHSTSSHAANRLYSCSSTQNSQRSFWSNPHSHNICT